ncbi:hypothetical protein ABPG72_010843 [Tetrahymena utriculariae]
MKRLVLFAALVLVTSCQTVYQCPKDGRVFKCSSEPKEVCGIKTVHGEQIKEAFVNSCQSCSLGKVDLTVDGKCENYLAEAEFCPPSYKDVNACTEQFQPQCAWFNQSVKCLVYPWAIEVQNRCYGCIIKNVLFITEGDCPKQV